MAAMLVGLAVCVCLGQEISGSIQWQQDKLCRVSWPGYRSAGYARMIELRDGDLLCVYEADGKVVASRSGDKGRTWPEPPVEVAKDGRHHLANPEILELKDGSLLACYNPRPRQSTETLNFAIRTKISRDGGRRWQDERTVYEGGRRFGDGCWEPAAIELPGGEIRLYFADESPFPDSEDQNISMMRSRDGGLTWTGKPEVVSYMPDGRDGMPVPLLLQDGKTIALAIEQTGWKQTLQPAIIRIPVDATKGPAGAESSEREQPLTEKLPRDIYAGAPYLRQLKSGETILTYQGTEGRTNTMYHADMKVLTGDSRAQNFGNKTAPFSIPDDRSALWNSICILKDDTIIAVTSTNGYSDKLEVWMIKGRLVRN